MTELAIHLRAQRAELVERMAVELAADGAWHAWLPLLAQVEVAIRAVGAVMEEDQGHLAPERAPDVAIQL